MIAVSQLDSGNERRSVASHILYAALPSGLCIMYDAVSRSGSGPSAAPVDRMAMSNFQVCHPRSDLPKSCCGAWTPRRRPEVRRVCFGEAPGSRGRLPGRQGVLLEGAEGSSDGLPLCLSQKSAPWTNQSVMAWQGLSSHQLISIFGYLRLRNRNSEVVVRPASTSDFTMHIYQCVPIKFVRD